MNAMIEVMNSQSMSHNVYGSHNEHKIQLDFKLECNLDLTLTMSIIGLILEHCSKA